MGLSWPDRLGAGRWHPCCCWGVSCAGPAAVLPELGPAALQGGAPLGRRSGQVCPCRLLLRCAARTLCFSSAALRQHPHRAMPCALCHALRHAVPCCTATPAVPCVPCAACQACCPTLMRSLPRWCPVCCATLTPSPCCVDTPTVLCQACCPTLRRSLLRWWPVVTPPMRRWSRASATCATWGS